MTSSMCHRSGLARRLRLRFRGTVIALSAGLLTALPAAAEPVRPDVFQKMLDRYIDNEELPGGVLLVSTPQQRTIAVSGLADRRTSAAITPDSRFYVASVGKMLVAVATLQLVEEGKLALDAPVAKLVGGVPNVGKLPNIGSAKLSQLLDHSSGIPDYMTDDYYEFYYKKPTILTPAMVLPYAFKEPAAGRAGSVHEYSNSNFVLLGDIIATADGVSLEEALRKRVLNRADMRSSSIGAKSGDAGLAHGYADPEDTGTEKDVSQYLWNCQLGDGPLVTTAADMEKFMFALLRDGKLLKPATVAKMVAPSALEREYGLGVERGKDRWGDWIGHSGLEDGFEAEIRYYPEHQAVIAFMTNGNSVSDKSIMDKAAKALSKAQASKNNKAAE